MGIVFIVLFLQLQTSIFVQCRKHALVVHDDPRSQIDISTFGFLKGGRLQMNLTTLHFNETEIVSSKKAVMGFTLHKAKNQGFASMLDNSEKCMLYNTKGKWKKGKDHSISTLFFKMFFHNMSMTIERRGEDFQNLTIYREVSSSKQEGHLTRQKRDTDNLKKVPGNDDNPSSGSTTTTTSSTTSTTTAPTTTTLASSTTTTTSSSSSKANGTTTTTTAPSPPLSPKTEIVTDELIPIKYHDPKHPEKGYRTYFEIEINQPSEEGLYDLYFHNCGLGHKKKVKMSLSIHMLEVNKENYLSAGFIPLPSLYFAFSVAFGLMGCFWLYVLRTSKNEVFKMHYMMLVLVFVKSASMLLHAVNFHYIAKEGQREETFAILWYITYLIRGTLLFITILLIGTGWAFIKHILSDRDKKIFVIVIPLQILSIVAQIVIEETEKGASNYTTWKLIWFMVDLICCGAIILPIIWSIRHLQEAEHTDGKAAISLAKLKIFRHFYLLIVCYIYFTRIIVYLLQITVTFQYEFLTELFRELATFIVFVITGYKFQPMSNNPYLQVTQEEDEVQMDQVLTRTGAAEGLTKVNVRHVSSNSASNAAASSRHGTGGPKQRESSHEYD